MQIRLSEQEGISILHLEGEIDLHSSPQLREVLNGHAKVRRPALAIDFAAVEYIDSSGLATLVEYVRNAQNFGGRLALAGLSPRVKTIFDLVRLAEFMPIFGSLEEAQRALQSRSSS